MERHLTVARTARYYQLGELSSATKQIWFVCHGYGQLAEYFKWSAKSNGAKSYNSYFGLC